MLAAQPSIPAPAIGEAAVADAASPSGAGQELEARRKHAEPPSPSIPKDNGSQANEQNPLDSFHKEREAKDAPWQAQRRGKGKGAQKSKPSRSRSRPGNAGIEAAREAARAARNRLLRRKSHGDDRADRRDDWNEASPWNHRESHKDLDAKWDTGAWTEKSWQEEGSFKESEDLFCSRHLKKRSWASLVEVDGEWVCRPGSECVFYVGGSKDSAELKHNGSSARLRSPSPLVGVTAKSSGAKPPKSLEQQGGSKASDHRDRRDRRQEPRDHRDWERRERPDRHQDLPALPLPPVSKKVTSDREQDDLIRIGKLMASNYFPDKTQRREQQERRQDLPALPLPPALPAATSDVDADDL